MAGIFGQPIKDFWWGFLLEFLAKKLGIFGGDFCLGIFGGWEFLDIPIQ